MNINMNYNGSWMELECWIPFRSWYMYWDKDECYGNYEFKRKEVKIRYIKGKFMSADHPFRGMLISCWSKDKTKVEEAMGEVDKKLHIIDKDYTNFLNKWRAGVEEVIIEEKE